jgi:mono/diheme cytochrome c family protein
MQLPLIHIRFFSGLALLGALALLLSGCYSDKSHRNIEYAPNMYNSLPLEPYSQTVYSTQPEIGGHYPAAEVDGKVKYFANGLSSQKAPEGTVPRTESWYYEEAYSPYPYPDTPEAYEEAGQAWRSPLEETETTVSRGKEVYEIYCVMCHGPNGKGQGSLVTGGAYVGVPAYNTLEITEGKMFHTLTWGKGVMGSYASQITPNERWQVIAYIKQWFPNYNGTSDAPEAAPAAAVTNPPAPAPAAPAAEGDAR